ncbi:hypothetical protein [Aequorivita echinoideorum]|uniref:Uncharacterized protein n=1 Tax=Aequorivita echinoideorum TaxID=1549647 RepID=A0ABS5S665_9FLAO|nr:hypothetical protein [Aequorivita echinoideorum]MBT0607872.1 hypothetical protein [Aequorivita echinoideorum]
MEFNSTVVGAIIVLLIFIPVIYLIVSASSGDKNVKKQVTKLAGERGANLNKIDVIGRLVIGVDEASRKLVYSSKRNAVADFVLVNMDDVKECRLKSIKNSEKTLDLVAMELLAKDNRSDIVFYVENDEDDSLSKDPFVCLQDAKRWEGIIRPFVKAS